MPSREIKSRQLCRQVQRVLQLEFGCCDDAALQSLHVDGVTTLGRAGQLLVTVSPMLPEDARPAIEVLAALEQASGRLRTAVADAIRRRKAPMLSYQISPHPAGEPQA